jgi:2-C-methyl-D-erythritol 4-phosphate cytidylyltransferase
MRYWLVMPAAGAGRRFGRDLAKQHAPLAGRTVLELALEPFLADSRCQGVALVVPPGEQAVAGLRWQGEPRVLVVVGGARRCDSVLAGLEAVAAHAPGNPPVLVHDAARPCLARADLDRLLAAGAAAPDGALLAAPVSDTLKRATADGRAEATVERQGLWRALTPQMAPLERLREALGAAMARGATPTDEAQALEWLGARPLLVAALEPNPKITLAADLPLAEALLAQRQTEAR